MIRETGFLSVEEDSRFYQRRVKGYAPDGAPPRHGRFWEEKHGVGKLYYTYMVQCGDGSLYTGYARDLEGRIRTHNRGKGAKYTKSRRPVRLVYYEAYEEKGMAMRRENELKRLKRADKVKLAEQFPKDQLVRLDQDGK